MSAAMPATAMPRSAFSRGGALALILIGFALFLALLALIGAGEGFGGDGNNGEAHATANGLNGYAGLVQLLEAEGYFVSRSRNPAGLETEGLLVLTPPVYMPPDEFAALIQKRERIGPTLVILPKWNTTTPSPELPPQVRAKFKRGWVTLTSAFPVRWTEDLPAPYALTHKRIQQAKDRPPVWGGLGLTGVLPTPTNLYANSSSAHRPLIIDGSGRALAVKVLHPQQVDNFQAELQDTIILAEPDLANNYGLADPARASVAVALVAQLTGAGDIDSVTFDMTLNGFGASENLLTLAFRPPFLAATLCLLMALVIIGWRAFMRFGPPAASNGPAIAFGKQQLIANGAGLILRARRFALLASPYAALSARRLADRLGLARADGAAIDTALARRLPTEEPFTRRAARLEAAHTPAEILSAAQALDDLTAKL